MNVTPSGHEYLIFMDALTRRLPTGKIKSDAELESYWFWLKVCQLMTEVTAELGFNNDSTMWDERAVEYEGAITAYNEPFDL